MYYYIHKYINDTQSGQISQKQSEHIVFMITHIYIYIYTYIYIYILYICIIYIYIYTIYIWVWITINLCNSKFLARAIPRSHSRSYIILKGRKENTKYQQKKKLILIHTIIISIATVSNIGQHILIALSTFNY